MSSKRSPSEDAVANTKSWKFKVKYALECAEEVCVTGDCDSLGNWEEKNFVPLSYDKRTKLWSINLDIPADRDVYYRYFTCSSEVVNGRLKTRIHQWETNIQPRKVEKGKVSDDSNEIFDVFGIFDGGTKKLESGWLVNDVAIFIRLNSTSIEWISEKSSHDRKTVINLSVCARDQIDGHLENRTNDHKLILYTRTENGKYEELRGRTSYSYNDTEQAVHVIRTFTFDYQVYMFEFLDMDDTSPLYRGYLMLDHKLGGSMGNTRIPIHASDQRHVGNLNVNYLIVRPTQKRLNLTFKSSFAKYWNNSWTCFEIGHRGSGKSFSKSATDLLNPKYRENTIGSFRSAGECGAHLVEFDVQLTSDLVPIVYHDFNVLLEVQQKTATSEGTLIVPFHKLSSENLKNFKIRHVREVDGKIIFENNDGEEFVPFPTLKRVLDSVDPRIGFNIEIKHTSQDEDNAAFDNPIDMNMYVDKILEVVFENAGLRYIVFSSFSPDICLMTRLKQNKYPVMFLTRSVKKPSPTSEELKKNMRAAINFANSADLLGIVAEARDLLLDPNLVEMISDSDLIPFSWGEDVNNDENIKKLKNYGVQGVIFDRIDQFGQKLKNDTIFSEGVL